MPPRYRGQRDQAASPRTPWHKIKSPDEAARALYAETAALEMASFQRRYRQALLYRLVTGDDTPEMFGYWMSARIPSAVGALNLANYVEPADNIIAEAMETFENRIGTLRPFVQVLPSGADFKIRHACSQAEFFVDALFENRKVYDETRVEFRDAGTWGQGHIKVSPTPDRKGVDIGRVLDDELIVNPIAARMGKPGVLTQRVYMSCDDVDALYVQTAPQKERDALAAAVRSAPRAFSGSFWAGPTSADMIALTESWCLPYADGTDGRRMLALPNKHLEDDKWTRDHYPFATLRWQPQSLGWRANGCAWALLPYQVEVNRHVDLIRENQMGGAFGTWLVEGNSKVTTAALGGRPRRIIRYFGKAPEYTAYQSNAPEMYKSKEDWKVAGFMRVGLNQQMAAGLKQPGITSGRALRTMVQIEDARQKSLQIALENNIRDIAVLALEAAEEVGLAVDIPGVMGGRIKWDDIAPAIKNGRVTVFPVHALVNDPEGRQQQIEEWYADGVIDKRAYFRLQSMPDTAAYSLMATAADDLIDATLDKIVETGEYTPPEPWDDLPQAMKTAQARYWLEKRLKTPAKTLRVLQQFMTAIAELMANPAGQMLQPAAPGMQPPALGPQAPGAAPAPPPPQSAPTLPTPDVAAAA